jgi:hypothetical protein
MNSIKIILAYPQISVLGHATKVSTKIIQTGGDINILFKHPSL